MARYMKSTGFAAALVAAALFGAFLAPQLVANADPEPVPGPQGGDTIQRPEPWYVSDADGNRHFRGSPGYDRVMEEREAAAAPPAAGESSAPSGPGIGTVTEDGTVPINSLSNVPCSVETGCSLAVILSDADGNLVPKIMTVQFYDMLPAQ